MVKKVVIEALADELVEQIVMTLYPTADVYAETKEGELELKRKYEEVRDRIVNILECELNS